MRQLMGTWLLRGCVLTIENSRARVPKNTAVCLTGGKRGKCVTNAHVQNTQLSQVGALRSEALWSLARPFLRHRRPPYARRQAEPEWPIDNPGLDKPVNSTGAGGANSAGVTRGYHGYFGPFERANTQYTGVPPGLCCPSIRLK